MSKPATRPVHVQWTGQVAKAGRADHFQYANDTLLVFDADGVLLASLKREGSNDE
ncbi:hypothetical protein [Phenylobacterium sp. SCN 70-31]|uniref:hypothetical protein n=1 Tax=Phenylobacterium sp. SCN 70-31 TaxID=1660129 RepID=UPI0025E2BD59|nr:hypothetical protein [Phenylobacterium sp. SCN 70-31]